MFSRLVSRAGEADRAEHTAAVARLAVLEGELAAALAERRDGDRLKGVLADWYDRAVGQSVSLSELLCLMAWSNGNVRKLSGETVAISGAVEEMARTIQNIAALSGTAQDRAGAAHRIVEAGVDKASSAGRAMTEISEAFSGLDQRMHQLGSAIDNIGGFAKEIEGISSQTKLLALNATIEAARAGEAGRGFAVVAAEVKALSEETSKTTDLIRGQLATLAQVMQDMLGAMAQGGTKVRDGTRVFGEVVEDMQSIRTCVDGVTGEISSITAMLQDQQAATDSIARNLTEIARLAGQNETDSGAAADAIRKAQSMVSALIAQGGDVGVADHQVRALKASHMIWKQQLAECLVGLLKIEPRGYAATVAPFGAGFKTVDDARFTGTAAWRDLAGLRDQLAREGVRVVEHTAAGDIGKAIDAYMAMDAASGTAMGKLAELDRLTMR